MSDRELEDIVPDLTPLLQSGVTEPPVPDLWDEFQGVQNAAARAALIGTKLEDLQQQYRDRFEKAAAFIDERAEIHSKAVESESKRLAELSDSLPKRQVELETEIKPLRERLPEAHKAYVQYGAQVNSLRRKVQASHLQFLFERENEVNQHRVNRRSTSHANDDDSWLTRLWPFRQRRPPDPIKPYEVKQLDFERLDFEDKDVPPELVDLVNAAWEKYSIAQVDLSSQKENYDRIAKELASVEKQIVDARNRRGWLDRYRVQILDFHKEKKLKLEIDYEQIKTALVDAYNLAAASKTAKTLKQ